MENHEHQKTTATAITGPQIRAGRAMLGWSCQELADRSALSYQTVQRAEQASEIPTMKANNLFRLIRTMEDAGIRFQDGRDIDGSWTGVILKS